MPNKLLLLLTCGDRGGGGGGGGGGLELWVDYSYVIADIKALCLHAPLCP